MTPQKAYPAGHPAALLLLALAPERLAGWTRVPGAEALAMLPDRVRGLGRVPRLLPGVEPEVVRAAGAGLIVDVGDAGAGQDAALADIARAAGVPLLTLDGRLAATPDSFRRLGAALNVTERAEMPARAAEDWLAITAGAAAPGLRIHYACGPDALDTPAAGGLAMEPFAHLGCVTIAPTGGPGLARVTVAQVAAFDPDWIVCLHGEGTARVLESPDWAGLRAVRTGRVLTVPALPFHWLDRPPGVNRLLGLLWLAAGLGVAEVPKGEIERCRRMLSGWSA